MNEDKEWRIAQVSQKPAREWNNPNGGVVYYKTVMLEGHPKAVSIGKKDPNALQVGSTVYGHIQVDMSGQEDKFKAGQNPNFGGGQQRAFSGGSSKPAYQPKDEEAIKAMWAIGQAVQLLHDGAKIPKEDTIEMWADTFFRMVNRVKSSEGGSESTNPKATPEVSQTISKVEEEDPEFASMLKTGLLADDVNLDDIPY